MRKDHLRVVLFAVVRSFLVRGGGLADNAPPVTGPAAAQFLPNSPQIVELSPTPVELAIEFKGEMFHNTPYVE